jgi:hypothetical protein
MVPAVSIGDSPTPTYSGYYYVHKAYTYGAFTLYGLLSQTGSVSLYF